MSFINKKRKTELENIDFEQIEQNIIDKLQKIYINKFESNNIFLNDNPDISDIKKLKKIEDKINKIEVKLETMDKIYAKLDSIENLIKKKLTEKDYIIENLTNENNELKKDLIESVILNEKDKEKENIYFY
jgi:hypothetical protein